jgi:PH domain/leucine-rich repeat-containing protein phosphatase
VKLLKMVKFRNENEALFGMFDGGYNDEVPKLLVEKMPNIVAEEIAHADTALEYMKYSFLSAHRQLRVSGQRLGASSALCHLKRHDSNSKQFSLQIANVGDVEAVLCRQDDAVVLTRKFTTTDNREECYRVCLSDGIIMEV